MLDLCIRHDGGAVVRNMLRRMQIPAFALLHAIDAIIPMLPEWRRSVRGRKTIFCPGVADPGAYGNHRHNNQSNNSIGRDGFGDSPHDSLPLI